MREALEGALRAREAAETQAAGLKEDTEPNNKSRKNSTLKPL